MNFVINRETLRTFLNTFGDSKTVLSLYEAIEDLKGSLDAAIERLNELDQNVLLVATDRELESLYEIQEIRPFSSKKIGPHVADFCVRIKPFKYEDLKKTTHLTPEN